MYSNLKMIMNRMGIAFNEKWKANDGSVYAIKEDGEIIECFDDERYLTGRNIWKEIILGKIYPIKKNRSVTLYVIRDYAYTDGFIGTDLEELKEKFKRRAENNEFLDIEDYEVLSQTFKLSDKMYNYKLMDELLGDNFDIVSIMLEPEDMQNLINFSKEVPSYSEDQLYETLSYFPIIFDGKDYEYVYW